jgi:hypothetical protein
MREMRNAYKLLVRKTQGKKAFGRPKRKWENDIKMEFIEIGCKDVNCIYVAQDMDQWRTLVNTALNILTCFLTS